MGDVYGRRVWATEFIVPSPPTREGRGEGDAS